MKQLNFTETNDSPYKFMGAMLAPKGSYWVETIDVGETKMDVVVYPAMYIQLWQDPEGTIWNVPMFAEEVQGVFADEGCTFQQYIERVINENRELETCFTGLRFINLCIATNNTDEDGITCVMREFNSYIMSGQVAATPEVIDYFRNGYWGEIKTLEYDGTLDSDWDKKFLNDDGTLKTDRV